jgi:hypothetical protein
MARSWTPNAGDGNASKDALEKPRTWPAANEPDISPDKDGKISNHANGFLQNQRGERIGLWVNGVDASFSMAGETYQSRKKREFYAHNFAQPVITISGQTPNTYQFNRLAEFVRGTHKQALHLRDQREIALVKLRIRGEKPTETTGKSRTIKGAHRPIAVDGFITMVERGAERFINAPDYQFDFVIVYAHNWMDLEERQVRRVRFESILKIIQDPDRGYKFVKQPTAPGKEDPPKGEDYEDNGTVKPPGSHGS